MNHQSKNWSALIQDLSKFADLKKQPRKGTDGAQWSCEGPVG
jgi:hypothetical protein